MAGGPALPLHWQWQAAASLTATQAGRLRGSESLPLRNDTFLVVGEYQAPLLRVLSLPRLNLVCTHRLAGVRLVGLASDPWASALVVCDAESREVRTL